MQINTWEKKEGKVPRGFKPRNGPQVSPAAEMPESGGADGGGSQLC